MSGTLPQGATVMENLEIMGKSRDLKFSGEPRKVTEFEDLRILLSQLAVMNMPPHASAASASCYFSSYSSTYFACLYVPLL